MTRRLSLAALAGASLLLAGVLTACATAAPGSPETPTPLPSDDASAPATPTDVDLDAAWLDSGRSVALVTQGSSTCVPFASDVRLGDNGVLEVTLEETADQPCTRDLVDRATVVGLPDGIDPTRELDIVVTGAYRGDTDLDGLSGPIPQTEEYAPSAGWVDDDLIVLLTWGSSGCPPVVENVDTSVENEVSVTFVEPAADRVCTTDMAPRATLIALADDDHDDDATTLVLSGDTFDGTRVPVLGEH